MNEYQNIVDETDSDRETSMSNEQTVENSAVEQVANVTKTDETTYFDQLSPQKQRNLINYKVSGDRYNSTLESIDIFLSALNIDASQKLVWQIIGDNKKGEVNLKRLQSRDMLDNQPFTTMHGLTDAFIANRHRCGVYLTINETKGKTRKASDIKSIRAFFLDLDGAPVEPVLEWKYKPHMVIKTSEGKFHCYWIIQDMPTGSNKELKSVFNEVQKLLAAKFNGDQSVIDLPRVMRVPGFFHAKKEPFLSRLVYPTSISEIQENRYSLKYDAFVSELKAGLEENEVHEIVKNHGGDVPAKIKQFEFDGLNLVAWVKQYGKTFRIIDALEKRSPDKLGKEADGGRTLPECPFEDDDHSPSGETRTVVYNPSEERELGFNCYSGHCDKRDRLEYVQKMLKDKWFLKKDMLDEKFGGGSISNVPDQIYVPAPQKIEGEYHSLASKCWSVMPDGRNTLMNEVPAPEENDDGEIYGIKSININLYYFLNRFGIAVVKDDFSGKFLVHGVPGTNKYSELDDGAYRAIHQTCRDMGLNFPITEFIDRIKHAAEQNHVHPVKKQLDNLEWDRVPRIDTWLSDYCSIDDNEYTRAVGSIWLIAAVRRVREPGVKFDTMPVFEGIEGTGKSSLFDLLAGDRWFTDALQIGMSAKEIIEIASGSWICEMAELGGMSKREVEHVKHFISKREDKARGAFDRVASTVPRQFVLVGTTNNKRYLMSTTGNRRFWPLEVKGPIDLEGVRGVKEQLWAEAAHREEQGESITLPEHLWKVAGIEQDKRLLGDPKADAIVEKFGEMEGVFVPTVEIYIHLGFVGADGEVNMRSVETRHKELVTQTMERMGWSDKQHPIGGGIRKRGWHKGKITKIYGRPPLSVKNISPARGAQSQEKVLEDA